MIQFEKGKIYVAAHCRSAVEEFNDKNNCRAEWVTDPIKLRGLNRGTVVYFLPRYSLRQENYELLEEIQRDRLVVRMVRADLVSLWEKPDFEKSDSTAHGE